ncbi:MAG: hypothetical protein V7K48_32875 [Nostoc sp.]
MSATSCCEAIASSEVGKTLTWRCFSSYFACSRTMLSSMPIAEA